LIYIKASLTGDEPPDVRHYGSHDPSFPHQATTDQFFDEAQFESYRRLGLHIIERICDRTRQLGPPDKPLDLSEFTARARSYCAAFGRQATTPGSGCRPVDWRAYGTRSAMHGRDGPGRTRGTVIKAHHLPWLKHAQQAPPLRDRRGMSANSESD
jgi:hypothetical protein